MTPFERLLWAHLRGKRFFGLKFYRQRPVGPYVVDFCCYRPRRLVVEIDGDDHFASKKKREYDRRRTAYLRRQGFEVVRFTNREVRENLEGVLNRLAEILGVAS